MSKSIKDRIAELPDDAIGENLRFLFEAILADLTAVRASVVGVNAKLDADAGVTGTDYASLWNPAALTLKS